MRSIVRLLPVVLLCLLAAGLVACRPAAVASVAVLPTLAAPATARPPVVVTASPTSAPTAAPTVAPSPTATSAPQPTAASTPAPSPTPNRDIPCSQRFADDGLLTVVTLTYGLSRDYVPRGLVPLDAYFSGDVTLGYPTELRHLVIGPLAAMIADMQAAGLHPFIISGYRSYSAQAIARQKWVEQEPERVNILSAPPGFSEHQLGTVVDFGSPELPEIVGQEDIEFHTYFYKTSEGLWLADNAHRYGFTLSYPFEATEVTGFFYEPWHYRYVGVEMATQLYNDETSLTEHQLATEPPPCIPDTP
ncbi:MAG: D-alanyl-D-alanine carboxypeptidase family protein [Anaerolineae bacterium]|nr:D-alanyl-D-alanine carboxypeptidase family protein [Anaerolineae bacterium]